MNVPSRGTGASRSRWPRWLLVAVALMAAMLLMPTSAAPLALRVVGRLGVLFAWGLCVEWARGRSPGIDGLGDAPLVLRTLARWPTFVALFAAAPMLSDGLASDGMTLVLGAAALVAAGLALQWQAVKRVRGGG